MENAPDERPIEQRLATAGHLLALRTRQLKLNADYWCRAAEEALAGSPGALRNRVEMHNAPPVEIVQS